MTPQEEEALARSRFAMLSAMRAGGVVMMLLGLLIWHSDVLREGGHAPLGSGLFLIGALASLLLPAYLIRRWRSPPGA